MGAGIFHSAFASPPILISMGKPTKRKFSSCSDLRCVERSIYMDDEKEVFKIDVHCNEDVFKTVKPLLPLFTPSREDASKKLKVEYSQDWTITVSGTRLFVNLFRKHMELNLGDISDIAPEIDEKVKSSEGEELNFEISCDEYRLTAISKYILKMKAQMPENKVGNLTFESSGDWEYKITGPKEQGLELLEKLQENINALSKFHDELVEQMRNEDVYESMDPLNRPA